MEKIKVNMSPNPLDVQTIHASQNDGEARQWEFELHNNGDVIDASEITDQMVFKAYKGGTEEILPTNGSVPTTAPFLGDIKYPQGLLSDQEFTYRQSPTEEDGLAKITDIKGNTLVWNQLVPTNWVSTRTFSDGLSVTNNNDGSYTLNGTATQSRFPTRNTEVYGIQGHKYLIQVLSSQNKAIISQNGSSVYVYDKTIYTAQNNNAFIIYFNANTYNNEKIIPMIIDLTQMFGVGNEPSTVEEFTSLFPLSYYSYNQGSLLSFNGNGIKTVGFNQWDEEWEIGGYSTSNGTKQVDNSRIRSTNFIRCLPNTSYVIKSPATIILLYYDASQNYLNYVGITNTNPFTTPKNACYMAFYVATSYGTTYKNDICINISSSKNGTYEPYKESSLSISTYFPTGMKSAGSVYDELLPTKAITRVRSVDLGTLTWTKTRRTLDGNILYRFRAQDLRNTIQKPSVNNVKANVVCAKYLTLTANNTYDGIEGISIQNDGDIYIYDTATQSMDATAFTSYIDGVYLYYELATPTETSFTTASLVTENTEIPLSNEDGVLIGKCTEQLSENPGFIDAKIKLSDADGECYSNKLQLHVERSPQ